MTKEIVMRRESPDEERERREAEALERAKERGALIRAAVGLEAVGSGVSFQSIAEKALENKEKTK